MALFSRSAFLLAILLLDDDNDDYDDYVDQDDVTGLLREYGVTTRERKRLRPFFPLFFIPFFKRNSIQDFSFFLFLLLLAPDLSSSFPLTEKPTQWTVPEEMEEEDFLRPVFTHEFSSLSLSSIFSSTLPQTLSFLSLSPSLSLLSFLALSSCGCSVGVPPPLSRFFFLSLNTSLSLSLPPSPSLTSKRTLFYYITGGVVSIF